MNLSQQDNDPEKIHPNQCRKALAISPALNQQSELMKTVYMDRHKTIKEREIFHICYIPLQVKLTLLEIQVLFYPGDTSPSVNYQDVDHFISDIADKFQNNILEFELG